jgi:hypothetical protein
VATAKIYPVKEWKLLRGAEEGFWSQTYDYETGAQGDLKNYRFERGDIAELVIRENLSFDSIIAAGDTVARIESYRITNEILQLQNLRDEELANLNVVKTGEKESLVEQAEREYKYAVQQLELQKKNYARQEILFLDSVIAPAEFEIHENDLKLAEINAQVAFEQYIALSTGEKDPVVMYSEQKTRSYEQQIESLEKQKNQYIILTPITGILSYATEPDGILKVSDLDRLILKIPVAYHQSTYLGDLHRVTFSTPDHKIKVNATFSGFEENVELIQSEQFVISRAVTEETIPGIYPGMIVQCRLYCDKVSLLEYLKRNFSVSF